MNGIGPSRLCAGVDGSGNLYVSNFGNDVNVKMASSGNHIQLASGGNLGAQLLSLPFTRSASNSYTFSGFQARASTIRRTVNKWQLTKPTLARSRQSIDHLRERRMQ